MSVQGIEIESASPNEQGSSLETELVDAIVVLEEVSDDEAYWHDARTHGLWTPSKRVPMVGICLVEKGVPVEIKGAQVWISRGYKAGRQRGRYYLKQRAHQQLLEARGVYLFAVYEPDDASSIKALLVVPASVVDGLLEDRWSDVQGSRSEESVAKVSWARIIAPRDVPGGGSR